MIGAVATVLNEEGIIGDTIEHLLSHGVDLAFVAHGPSSDNTVSVLRSFGDRVVVRDDPSEIHLQPERITELAGLAKHEGCEWIIPFDADEFWCPVQADTIKEALEALPPQVTHLVTPQYHYHSLTHRWEHPNWLTKLAFRYQEGISVLNGNHGVSAIQGEAAYDVLVIRELQFLSLEHMREKSTLRVQTIDPDLGFGEGQHQRLLAAMSDVELEAKWAEMGEMATVNDPIPIRRRDAPAGS